MVFSSDILGYLTGEKFSSGLSVKIADSKTKIYNRLDLLTELCSKKRVVHIGFADHIELIESKILKNQWLHKRLIDASAQCLGIDLNEDYIDYAKGRYERQGVDFLSINAQRLNKIEETFDLIIMINMIHHLSTYELNTLLDKLVVNINFSRIIIIDVKVRRGPLGWFLKSIDQGSYFRQLDEIIGIFSQYFRIEDASVIGKPYWFHKYSMVVAKKLEDSKIK